MFTTRTETKFRALVQKAINMIRIQLLVFCLLSSSLVAQTIPTNNECVNKFVSQKVTVTDVRLHERDVIEADLLNESTYHVAGYGLFYVFDLEHGSLSEDVPTYMLKFPIAPGEAHTHRMRLADFDLTADEVDKVAVHVVASQVIVPSGQAVPPTHTTCR